MARRRSGCYTFLCGARGLQCERSTSMERESAQPSEESPGPGEGPPPSKRPRLSPSPALADPAAALSAECAAHVAATTHPNQAESAARLVQMAVAAVERVAQQNSKWRGATCQPFGSSVTTLGTATSDIDMSVNLPTVVADPNDAGARRKAEQKIVKQLAGLMRRDAAFVTTQAVPEARVPLVRSLLAVGGLQCDLTISNELAVLNSQLMRAYVLADPRVRPVALLVRAWGNARGLMDPRKGGLTSYAMLLLLLTFLQQQVNPPVLPRLQPPPPLPPTNEGNDEDGRQRNIVNGFDCTFSSSPPGGWQPAPGGAHSVGTLLHGFFDFYGHRFGRPTSGANGFKHRILRVGSAAEAASNGADGHATAAADADGDEDGDEDEDDVSVGLLPPIVSLRLGRLVQRSERADWTEPRWLTVEDPFEVKRNVANTLR